MKAAVLYDIEKLKIENIPVPKISDKEILIRIKACTICGTDVRIYHYGHKNISFPRITGHELAGEIVEVGKKVKDYKEGQKVTVAPHIPCGKCYYCQRGMQSMCLNFKAIAYHFDGGFAEFMRVPEIAIKGGCVNLIPDNLSFEEAALAEPLACAINGQELSGTKLADTVAVIGAGPLGCMHIQLARVKGAKKVILLETSFSRTEFARNFVMPDVLINPSRENAIEKIREETEGRGADKVIVACSNARAQEESLKMVSPRGVVNFFGGLPKNNPYIKFDSNLVHYKEFYVVGTHGSAPHHNRLALDLISQGKIKVKELITHKLPLEKIIEGLNLAQSGKAMKVAILP